MMSRTTAEKKLIYTYWSFYLAIIWHCSVRRANWNPTHPGCQFKEKIGKLTEVAPVLKNTQLLSFHVGLCSRARLRSVHLFGDVLVPVFVVLCLTSGFAFKYTNVGLSLLSVVFPFFSLSPQFRTCSWPLSILLQTNMTLQACGRKMPLDITSEHVFVSWKTLTVHINTCLWWVVSFVQPLDVRANSYPL